MKPDTKTYVVADDYGLSPGVSAAIRHLLQQGKIDGTGCMTLFPEWESEARSMRALQRPTGTEIGLHLTLTDFAPLSGKSPLRGETKLPALRRLIAATYSGRIDRACVHAELDLQLQRFIEAMGQAPSYIDGHQHIHFLPPVRRWLAERAKDLAGYGDLPWLRGQPSLRGTPDRRSLTKAATVGLLASGFDRGMKQIGFPVRGPLSGFYDWTRSGNFSPFLDSMETSIAAGSVFMCHPGRVDTTLLARDAFTHAREEEYEALLNRDRRSQP